MWFCGRDSEVLDEKKKHSYTRQRVREVFPDPTSLEFFLSSMVSLRTRTPFPVVADQAGQGACYLKLTSICCVTIVAKPSLPGPFKHRITTIHE